jgi:hypothetical protein
MQIFHWERIRGQYPLRLINPRHQKKCIYLLIINFHGVPHFSLKRVRLQSSFSFDKWPLEIVWPTVLQPWISAWLLPRVTEQVTVHLRPVFITILLQFVNRKIGSRRFLRPLPPRKMGSLIVSPLFRFRRSEFGRKCSVHFLRVFKNKMFDVSYYSTIYWNFCLNCVTIITQMFNLI